MRHKPYLLKWAMILALLCGPVVKSTGSPDAPALEQALHCIRDCMARSPAPWPDKWEKEYIDTVRSAIELYRDGPHHAERLEILVKGFAAYWKNFTKTTDRSLFEVHRAAIRWYVEHLMGTEFPTQEERQRLRDQYTEIWDYAASSLLVQFPFLDPNAAQSAKADDLQLCCRKIETPLLPVYLRPFSEEQVAQIKQRWDDLRYARVDLWRGLADDSRPFSKKDPASPNAGHDYELTRQSLSQLLVQVWMVVPQRPDYYLCALEDQANAAKRIVRSKGEAQSYQRRLEQERSRQLLQTEHVSFLLAALLETQACLDRPASGSEQGQTKSHEEGRALKGGDTYDLKNVPR